MVSYTTKDGDVLDWLVWVHYGTVSVLEKVMKENPSVTNDILKAGIVIKLPYIETNEKKNKEIRLWS